jgi:hypothetical protein
MSKPNCSWQCELKGKPCPYAYDACFDPDKFCRILEDTPKHFFQSNANQETKEVK